MKVFLWNRTGPLSLWFCFRRVYKLISHSIYLLNTFYGKAMQLSLCLGCVALILVLFLKSSNALKKIEVDLGQSETLKCDMSYHHEINWLRMGDDGKLETLMVVGLKNDGALSVAWNSNETLYEGCVIDRFIGMKIHSVSKSDLATYFCAASSYKQMEFGEGIHLYTGEQSKMQGQEQGLISNSGEKFQSNVIIAVALSCGLLLMVSTLVAVHVKTQKRQI